MKPEIYFGPLEFTLMLFILAIMIAGLMGFAIGIIFADNRRMADDAYNPKLRPDESFKTR
ncbi:hypothetical protein [Spirosoma lituiforme]